MKARLLICVYILVLVKRFIVCANVCGQSCFVRSPVLRGLFGVVVPCWNIGVDSFRGLHKRRAAKFLWLEAVRRSRGQASPPAHPTNPFMFPNRRPRAAPHSYCSTNACVCLIPETWWQWPPCHEWKKSLLFHSVLCLLLIFILKLSLPVMFVFLSLCLPVPILVCVSLIITFWYWCFPEVTDHRFSCHMCFFANFFFPHSPLFIASYFSGLYYIWLRVWMYWQHGGISLTSKSSRSNSASDV